MSDWGGGDLGGDFGDFDWSQIFGNNGGEYIPPPDYGTPNPGYGYGDRGLGTGGGGTLTPGDIAGLGPGPGGGGGGFSLADLGRLFGVTNKDGSANGLGWLSLLGPLLGAGLNYTSTGKATDQALQGIKDANTAISGLNSTNQALWKPYTDMMPGTIAKMQAAGNSNIAGNFQPLGAGRGLTLGSMARSK